MSDALKEPKTEFSDEDYKRMGMHGLDVYNVRDLRHDIHKELESQRRSRSDNRWNLVPYREQFDADVSDIEETVYFLREVDRLPIEWGTTAFVGWFTDE